MPVSQQSWNQASDIIQSALDECCPIHPTITKQVVVHDRSFNVSLCTNKSFWDSMASGEWEPATLELIKRLVTSQTTYIDIGAWIGPTLLHAAARARSATGFEPDPVAFRILERNMSLNPDLHAKCINQAISKEPGTVELYTTVAGGDSKSSMYYDAGGTSHHVPSTTLAKVLKNSSTEGHIVMKIDIEGGEFMLVDQLHEIFAHYDIDFIIAMHPQLIRHNSKSDQFKGIYRSIAIRLEAARMMRKFSTLFKGAAFSVADDLRTDKLISPWHLGWINLADIATFRYPGALLITKNPERLN